MRGPSRFIREPLDSGTWFVPEYQRTPAKKLAFEFELVLGVAWYPRASRDAATGTEVAEGRRSGPDAQSPHFRTACRDGRVVWCRFGRCERLFGAASRRLTCRSTLSDIDRRPMQPRLSPKLRNSASPLDSTNVRMRARGVGEGEFQGVSTPNGLSLDGIAALGLDAASAQRRHASAEAQAIGRAARSQSRLGALSSEQ